MVNNTNTKKTNSKETGMTASKLWEKYTEFMADVVTAGGPAMLKAAIKKMQQYVGETEAVPEKVEPAKKAVAAAKPTAAVEPQAEAAAAEEADAEIDAAPAAEDAKARKLRLDRERRVMQQKAKAEAWTPEKLAAETAKWKAANGVGEKKAAVTEAPPVETEAPVAPPVAAPKAASKFAKKETPVAAPVAKAVDAFKVGDVVLFTDLSDGSNYKLKLTEIDAVNSLIKGIPAAVDKSSEAPDVAGNDFSVFEASSDWSEVAIDGNNIKAVAAAAATKSSKNKKA